MAKRKIPLVDSEYYHVYNRGNSKQKIFLDKSDYEHFIKLLFVCNTKKNFRWREDIIEAKIDAFDFERGESIVDIGSWVLMPNHFHIYIKIHHISPMSDIGRDQKYFESNNITEFVRKVSTAYVKYFNKKYQRTGSLFEGPFKSVHIKDDIQAKYLFSYIHLNPLKLIDKNWKENGISDINKSLSFLKEYEWGSYLDFLGEKRKENQIINLENFPDYFLSNKNFSKEIFDWLDYNKQK